MKQHITKKQWNEITEKQKEEIKSVVIKNDDPYIGTGSCSQCGNILTLNIGQMIEFLEEEYNTAMASWQGWAITIDKGRYIDVHTYESNELCDALWEAVKEVLNKDE